MAEFIHDCPKCGHQESAEIERLRAEVEALRGCRDELREATEAMDDPAINNIVTLPQAIRTLRWICADMRGALQELRIRLHSQGRRPEECYEMSIIDAALAKGE